MVFESFGFLYIYANPSFFGNEKPCAFDQKSWKIVKKDKNNLGKLSEKSYFCIGKL